MDDRPRQAHDTRRWFVVCVNPLGSCRGAGSTAASINRKRPALSPGLPELSIADGADAPAALVRGLGIQRLACVVGTDGRMSALALLARHPGIAPSHVNICGAARALPFSIAIRSLQREAIRLDPQWNDGAYDDAEHYPKTACAWRASSASSPTVRRWSDGSSPGAAGFRSPRGRGRSTGVRGGSYLEATRAASCTSTTPTATLPQPSMDWFDRRGAGDTAGGLAAIEGVRHAGDRGQDRHPVPGSSSRKDRRRRNAGCDTVSAMPSPGPDASWSTRRASGPAYRRILRACRPQPRPAARWPEAPLGYTAPAPEWRNR